MGVCVSVVVFVGVCWWSVRFIVVVGVCWWGCGSYCCCCCCYFLYITLIIFKTRH